jgi:glycogen phosphorylase
MRPIRIFSVIPKLPAVLEPLRRLANNVFWSWNHDTIELFRRLDADLWEAAGHNPVLMLGTIDQRKLEAASRDESFLAHLDRVLADFDRYLEGKSTWFKRTVGERRPPLIAYFSAEFGLTECLSIFAGGLGVLAGDHLKSSSDLGIPLVGVGLLYQQGYFRQRLNAAGWQQEIYEDNDFHNLPLVLERGADGTPLDVEVQFPDSRVHAQIWKVAVGRVNLYLLDSNTPLNARTTDRDLTDQLYGGDKEMRIRQEILLGIGGLRALEALGIEPTVCHMNEGHSAFLGLELVRRLMERQKLSFAEAKELASSSLVFTTHTPVEAGHDYFGSDLMEKYFGSYRVKLGLSPREFMSLGRRNPDNDSEEFCMTILALRMAAFSNGVSALHGEVSRKMWDSIWPGLPLGEIPIGHVTNGVHFRSWISNDMNQLYDRYLGPSWREEHSDPALWKRVETIPAEELWRTHERRRERLVAFARRRLHEQLQRRGVPQSEISAADEVLDPEALTIGFARRFATYKRATLFLRDRTRLARILNDPDRPVQIIFAGKAHPRDDAGKELIRQIASLIREPAFRRRLVFIEDYDVSVARYLVQGVDVWLNTPLRPLEASGTSGMKALANGALNLSTLDGWWDEAWRMGVGGTSPVGWAVGQGLIFENRDLQDQADADSLYDMLERDIIPLFYDRRADGLPRGWISSMKSSIAHLCHFFNTQRMVREYTERFYFAADENQDRLASLDAAGAKELARWTRVIRQAWPQVRVEIVDSVLPVSITVRERVDFGVRVHAGPLTPEDLRVELYLGPLDANGNILEATPIAMNLVRTEAPGRYLYEVRTAPCCRSGRHGFTARVLPRHKSLKSAILPGMITWAAN